MNVAETEQTEREEHMARFKEQLLSNGNLSPEEVDEFIRFEFVTGPSSVEAQVRRYYLMIKRDRPNKADQMMSEVSYLISKGFKDERDIHDISVVLTRYINGFVVNLPPTPAMLEEMKTEFPLPLKIRVAKIGSKPCRIWRGKSEWAKWKAWRRGRPTVVGYGMTERKAIEDLRYRVQPDHNGTLDGKGKPSGPMIGGNMSDAKDQIRHNKALFEE